MLRLCIIGASHVPALADGWARIAGEGGMEGVIPTFFTTSFDLMEVRSGVLTIASERHRSLFAENGATYEVQLNRQDAFVIAGVGRFKDIVTVYDHSRGESHAEPRPGKHVVSDACFEAAVLGLMREDRAGRFARMLRAATQAPIALTSVPMFRSGALTYPKLVRRLSPLREAGDEVPLAGLYRSMRQRLYGDDFTLVDQPPETLQSPAFTRDEYSIGTVPHKGRMLYDTVHMTGEYGALALRRCIDWARTSVAAQAPA